VDAAPAPSVSEKASFGSLFALKRWEEDTGGSASFTEGNAFIDRYDAGRKEAFKEI
jgi:hypothetical protein